MQNPSSISLREREGEKGREKGREGGGRDDLLNTHTYVTIYVIYDTIYMIYDTIYMIL